ncbi:F-box protein [Trifolium pratense]|uniref:F-box protein n=1 Tax=Trifolium pratense TaxID=57577 RepID=A0A2K3L5S5_TRIPR|nr:F-box protein [Trifolium pratense]
MNGGGFPTNILVLDGKNWDRWSAMMKSLFGAQEVSEIVQNGYEELGANSTEAQRETYRDAKKKDCKALFYIQQNVDSQHFEKIAKATKSKEAWDILEGYHTGGDKVKKVKLQAYRRQYESLQMDEDQKSSLEAHEIMVVNRGSERSNQQALQAQTSKKECNSKNFKKGKDSWVNGDKSKVDDKPESSKGGGFVKNQNKKKRDFDKSKVKCYNCEKYGHFAEECWSKKDQQEANIAEGSEANVVLMMATTCDDNVKSEDWYLDSGCSKHMTSHREWLTNFNASKKTSIRLADSSKLAVEGAGNIVIRSKSGRKVIIEDVLYVPKMSCNSMSICQLVEKGFSVTIEGPINATLQLML